MAFWIGLDINETCVHAAVIRANYRVRRLHTLVSVPVQPAHPPTAPPEPLSASSEDTPKEAPPLPDPLQEAIREAFAQACTDLPKEESRSLGISMPGTRVALHPVTLPASARRQVREVLPFELEAELPFPLEDAVFDMAPLPAEAPNTLSFLVAVAHTAEVRAQITKVADATDCEPERVSVGGFSFAHLLHPTDTTSENEAPTVHAILHLDATASDLLIVSNGQPVFGRTILGAVEDPPGGQAASTSSSRPEPSSELVQELRRTFGGYQADGGALPSCLLLAGSCAPLAHKLGLEALGIPLAPISPEVTPLTIAAEWEEAFPVCAKAIALALSLQRNTRGLNLRQGPLLFTHGFGWLQEKRGVLFALLVAFFVSLFFSEGMRLRTLQQEQTVREAALVQGTKAILGEATPLPERAQALLAKQTSHPAEDPMPHRDALDVMIQLAKAVPSAITHDIEELDVQQGHVVVHGLVPSIPDAQAIASALQNEPCFADVKITRTNQVAEGTRQKYVLEWDLRCPTDTPTPPRNNARRGAS